jgi:WD40 repeat protein
MSSNDNAIYLPEGEAGMSTGTNQQDTPMVEVEDSILPDVRATAREPRPVEPGAVRVTGPGGDGSISETVTNETARNDVSSQCSNQEVGLITAFMVEDAPTIYEAEAISEEEQLQKRRQRTQRLLIVAGALVVIAIGVVVAAVVSSNKRKERGDATTQIVTVTNAPSFPPSMNPSASPSVSPTSPISWEPFGQELTGKAAGERFGSFVDISGNGNVLAIVSGHVSSPNSTIQVFAMNRARNTWQQVGSDSLQNQTGSVVSLSKSGDILAIGDPRIGIANDTLPGMVRIFQLQRSGTKQWIQRGSDINGMAAGDHFGSSVSLSDDGSVAAVGAMGSLTMYVYDSSMDTWAQLGQNIAAAPSLALSYPVGSSVALSGDGQVVAVGENENNRVRVYDFHPSTETWNQLGSNIVGNPLYYAQYFGTSVSLSSNGRVLAAGDPNQTPGSDGAAAQAFVDVHVYNEIVKEWELLGETIKQEAGTDGLGMVCLSGDGSIVAIGASLNDDAGFAAGHVRVHQNDNELGKWQQIGPDIDGMAPFDQAGDSIALSSNGDVLVVSASLNDANGSNSGQLRVYQVMGGRFTPAPSISPAPTESPSTAPTFLSSYIDLAEGCREIEPLSGQENATLINFDDVSVCGGFDYDEPCTAAVSVQLPFTFLWFGDTPITSVAIDAGGQINIDNSLEVINGIADTIEVGGIYTHPRIAILKSEGVLSPGSIFTLNTGSSFIISLEEMFFLHPDGLISRVNGQVELFPNGNIEIRKDGEIYTSVAVGIEDDTRSPPEAFPGCGPFVVRQQ